MINFIQEKNLPLSGSDDYGTIHIHKEHDRLFRMESDGGVDYFRTAGEALEEAGQISAISEALDISHADSYRLLDCGFTADHNKKVVGEMGMALFELSKGQSAGNYSLTLRSLSPFSMSGVAYNSAYISQIADLFTSLRAKAIKLFGTLELNVNQSMQYITKIIEGANV